MTPPPTVPQLLAALQWPPEAGLSPGTLTWTKTTDDGPKTRIYIASVVLTRQVVFCRLRSSSVDQPWVLRTHMEATWDLQTAVPYLTKWVSAGNVINPYEGDSFEKALSDFQQALDALDVEPVFQPAQVPPNRRSR